MTSRGIARTLVFGPERRVNVGLVNGRRFLMMAGVGFDAHVVARVSPRVKRLLGRMTYVFELLQGLFRFPYRRYRVTIDGRSWDAASVVVANGHFYGGRFTVAPQARLDDPHLDVCLFLGSGPWNVVRYGLALLLGRLDRLADVCVVRGSEIVIDGAAGEPVQCDGDVVARLPLVARPSGLHQLLVTGA
jgi:diacylglycerol kinase family enzyme